MSHSFPCAAAQFCVESQEVRQDTQAEEKAEDTGAISLMEYVHGSCRYLVRDMGYSNSLYKAVTLRSYT